VRLAGACALAVVLAAPPAAAVRADPLYQTGFEGPTWKPNVNYNFTNPDHLAGITPSGVYSVDTTNGKVVRTDVSTSSPASGAQALRMRRLDSANLPFSEEATTGIQIAFPKSPLSFGSITYSADVRLNGPASSAAVGVQAGLRFNSDDSYAGNRIYLAGNGHVYGDYGNVDGGPVAMGAYHSLSMTYDVGSQTTYYSVDGKLIGSASEYPDPALLFPTLSTQWYGGDSVPRYDPSQYTALFDNFAATTGGPVVTAPEPGSLALLAAGGAVCGLTGLGRWRRRRRARA
jgi:hypothetical protein